MRRILSLILFGIAFGYLEASVVVYLRTIGGPARAALGLSSQDLFPLLRVEQLPPAMLGLLKLELGREAATLVMLATAAAAAAGGYRGPGVYQTGGYQTPGGYRNWLGAFVLAFGVWDLTFYAWLHALIGWPASLMTWDILFLLPVPWAAPVLAPVIVAGTMAIFGAWMLAREPKRGSRLAGWVLGAGAAMLFASFIWDWRRWMNGSMPQDFPWGIFALGEAGIIAGFLLHLRSSGDVFRRAGV